MKFNLYKKLGIGGLLLAVSAVGECWALWEVVHGNPVTYATTWMWLTFLIAGSMLVYFNKANGETVRLRLRMTIVMLLSIILAMLLNDPIHSIVWAIVIWRACDVGLMYFNWKFMQDAEIAFLDAAAAKKFVAETPPRVEVNK